MKDILYIDTADKKTFLYTEKAVYESALRLYELEDALGGDFHVVSSFHVHCSRRWENGKASCLSGDFSGVTGLFLRVIQSGLPEGDPTLPELEQYCRKLDLYFSFAKAFDCPVDEDKLYDNRERAGCPASDRAPRWASGSTG